MDKVYKLPGISLLDVVNSIRVCLQCPHGITYPGFSWKATTAISVNTLLNELKSGKLELKRKKSKKWLTFDLH